MKTAVIVVLLLPLVLTSSALLSAPENGYRIVAKFQCSDDTLPGETVDDGWGIASQWFPENLFDIAVAISSSRFGDLGSHKNTYRLFYNLVPIRKLNVVFVI